MSDTAAVESPDLPIFASGMRDSIENRSRSSRWRWHRRSRHARASGRTGKAPPAFVISNIEVTDPSGYQKIWGGSGGLREWQMTNYK